MPTLIEELEELLAEWDAGSLDDAGVQRVRQILPLLPSLRGDEALSDSVRCWSMAAGLGLELAHRQAVVPHVTSGQARWRALLSRRIEL